MIRARVLDAARTAARRRRQPRPLGSVVLRTLLPRVVLFAALCAALGVGNALTVDPLGAAADSPSSPSPTWTTAEALAHPDCVAASTWPRGRVADAVVAYDFGAGRARRIRFDRAWALNHDATSADDVWVVGICP